MTPIIAIKPGDSYEVIVSLDVDGGQNARLFADAIAHSANIGIVFGSAGGRGHGVYASAPCTVELIALEVLA